MRRITLIVTQIYHSAESKRLNAAFAYEIHRYITEKATFFMSFFYTWQKFIIEVN